jgi:hypothetical protein
MIFIRIDFFSIKILILISNLELYYVILREIDNNDSYFKATTQIYSQLFGSKVLWVLKL